MYATSIIILLGTPVVAITILLLAVERILQIGSLRPGPGRRSGAFPALFWFYSHPAVYIMILPAMGVVTEIVPCFARKNIYGYKFIAFSSLAIAVLGFLVWGHHMFVAGESVYAAMVFSILSFLVAVPSAIKVFNWTATLYKGSVSFATPMLFAFGFIGMFTIGGLTGLFLATLGTDVHLHDTYFVIAHFHFIMVGGTVMAYMGGLHYWWPKMTGRMYPEVLGPDRGDDDLRRLFPDVFAAVRRRLRRHAAALSSVCPGIPGAQCHVVRRRQHPGRGLCFAFGLPDLVAGLWPRASSNPWKSTGLEWQTPSPPPPDNFPVTPVVTGPPYQYSREVLDVH